ncbi:PD-(D/E)XK nuclease family protein [Candidatus Parcubacteria bacterium]|nr:PD-(D/E)XK nuclease family protein [Candidatus Parcubacteria bacterium]
MAYIFPKKIFPNALNVYLQCPFKFKCHCDKEIKAEFIERPESFVGKVIHSVLNDFFDIAKVPVDKRKHQDLSKMLKYSWARMPKNGWSNDYWSDEERIKLFGSAEQEKAFGLKAIAILSNYISSTDLSVVPLSLEDWMEYDMGEFILAGRIDRIDQNSNSSIAVWDYKTGKLPYHNNVEKMMQEDLQIPIYAVIASNLNPFAEKIRAGLIYIKYSRVYDIVWTKDELKEIENKIITAIKKARDDNDLLPHINKLCPWCEYKEICPDKDKIEEKYKKIDEVTW